MGTPGRPSLLFPPHSPEPLADCTSQSPQGATLPPPWARKANWARAGGTNSTTWPRRQVTAMPAGVGDRGTAHPVTPITSLLLPPRFPLPLLLQAAPAQSEIPVSAEGPGVAGPVCGPWRVVSGDRLPTVPPAALGGVLCVPCLLRLCSRSQTLETQSQAESSSGILLQLCSSLFFPGFRWLPNSCRCPA